MLMCGLGFKCSVYEWDIIQKQIGPLCNVGCIVVFEDLYNSCGFKILQFCQTYMYTGVFSFFGGGGYQFNVVES